MSQNEPSDHDLRDDAREGDPNIESNPYYQAGSREPEPDLDAAAPNLRAEENQRLNRKALIFLGGIVVLLLAMGTLLFVNMRGDKQEKVTPVREIAPYVPAARNDLPTLPPAEVAQVEPLEVAELPPPPPQLLPLASAYEPLREIPSGPSLMQRRMADGGWIGQAGGQGLGGEGAGDDLSRALAERNQALQTSLMAAGGGGAPPPLDNSVKAQLKDISQASFLRKPDTLLLRGTFIRCILETRIITDYSGFTSCVVTEPVYSVNGSSLLLPKGSKLSGTYNGGGKVDRVGVIWDRVTTPTGIDVLMSSPGVDNLGGAGHPGDLNNHWGSRIASALLVSLLADAFKYAAAKNGPESTAISDGGTIYSQPYESATARTMERMAGEVVQQAMSRPPTVTINQGTVVNVYVAKDVDFSGVVGTRR